MELFSSKLLSSLIQIFIFSLIPLIWWLIFFVQKGESFFSWIGLKGITERNKKDCYKISLMILVGFIVLSVGVLWMVRGIETAASEFQGMGIKVLPAALIYAFLNTALPEEILFRGFLLKRLSNKFGFKMGNLIQSALFGFLHGIMFFNLTGPVQAFAITVFTGGVGWSIGYVNEQKADGSILPGWLIHGAANLFSALISMLALF